MATSASTVGLPEDKAYIAHHFKCPTCIAAGATPGKQARCPEGQTLWDQYNRVTGSPLPADHAAQRNPRPPAGRQQTTSRESHAR